MFLRKAFTVLADDVKWGRIALLALGASLAAVWISGGEFSLLPLTLFSIAGILIERFAPRRPFVNALFYGLLGVLFYVVLWALQILGQSGPVVTIGDLLALSLSVGIVVLPQALIGAWIGISIRKFGQAAAEARKKEEQPSPPPKKGAPSEAGKKDARPARGQAESPRQSRRQRKKGG